MNLDRFQALAEAFGGSLERWPEEERTEAARLLTQDPEAAVWLCAASKLDGLLDDWTTGPPSAQLRARALSHAPRPPISLGRLIWLRRIGVWTSGAGLVAAGMLGVVCGTTVSTAALADARDQALVASASSAQLEPLSGPSDEAAVRAGGRRVAP